MDTIWCISRGGDSKLLKIEVIEDACHPYLIDGLNVTIEKIDLFIFSFPCSTFNDDSEKKKDWERWWKERGKENEKLKEEKEGKVGRATSERKKKQLD